MGNSSVKAPSDLLTEDQRPAEAGGAPEGLPIVVDSCLPRDTMYFINGASIVGTVDGKLVTFDEWLADHQERTHSG